MHRQQTRVLVLAVTVVVFLIILSRLGEHDELREFDHSILRPVKLSGEELRTPEALGLPAALTVRDGRLMVLDAHGDPAVHLLDAVDGRPLASAGRRGDGPGEFRVPRSFAAAPGDPERVWIFDIGLQRLTQVDWELEGFTEGAEAPVLRLMGDAIVTDPYWVDQDTIVALGFFPGARFGRFDGQGRPAGTLGRPPEWEREVPAHVLQHAFQGTLALRPDGSFAAVAVRHAGRLEIHGMKVNRGHEANVPFSFSPRFQVREGLQGPAMATGRDLRFGYIHAAATQERIYALFSGRTRAGFPGRANYGEHVHVFDWEGAFLKVFRLDAEAFGIAVDEAEGVLYAIRHLPVPAVLTYRILP